MADGSTRINAEIEAAKALKLALGEHAEDGDLLQDMIEGQTSLFEMIDAVVDQIGKEQELIDGIQKRQDELAARKERIRYRQAGFKAMIEQAMTIIETKKLERPEATLSLSKRADKLVIYDEAEVPAQFFKRQDPVIDKKSLTAALKAIDDPRDAIPGARLEPSPQTLTIRRA